jgi:hypothetical protein
VLSLASVKQEVALGAPGRWSKTAGVGREVALGGWLNFELFTKLPLTPFCKLLSNFL